VVLGGPKGKGIGSLKVLEGPPGLIGETFQLTRQVTMIGRNAEAAHIVFYPDEDSTISRVHCTIREAGKYVVLVDNNSTNGTSINGHAVKPNEMVQLRDGDEIVLGNLANRGVKLKFSPSAGKPASSAPEGLDRTFILDEWDQDKPVEPSDKP
jgi:pSer/pThr/pTyr-binding forkhead associated (FHA) protein